MGSLAGSAFLLLLVLLPAPLAAEPSSAVTPALAREPRSALSDTQAVKPACAQPGSCVAQASAGEPEESRAVETGQSPEPTPSSVPAAVDRICKALARTRTSGARLQRSSALKSI